MKFSLLFGAVLAFGSVSHADLLFLGFNPAEGEIKAVGTIARERGEKLVVFPGKDPALTAQQ